MASPTGPIVERYRLLAIDGAALPTVDKAQPASLTTDGSIVLVGDDSAEVRQTLETPATAGNPQLTVFQLGYYSVIRKGDVVILLPHTTGLAPDTAIVSGQQLVLRQVIPGTSPPAVEQLTYGAQ